MRGGKCEGRNARCEGKCDLKKVMPDVKGS